MSGGGPRECFIGDRSAAAPLPCRCTRRPSRRIRMTLRCFALTRTTWCTSQTTPGEQARWGVVVAALCWACLLVPRAPPSEHLKRRNGLNPRTPVKPSPRAALPARRGGRHEPNCPGDVRALPLPQPVPGHGRAGGRAVGSLVRAVLPGLELAGGEHPAVVRARVRGRGAWARTLLFGSCRHLSAGRGAGARAFTYFEIGLGYF